MKKEFTPRSVRLQGCNDLFYQVVTSLYRRVGNRRQRFIFQPIILNFSVSNNYDELQKHTEKSKQSPFIQILLVQTELIYQ